MPLSCFSYSFAAKTMKNYAANRCRLYTLQYYMSGCLEKTSCRNKDLLESSPVVRYLFLLHLQLFIYLVLICLRFCSLSYLIDPVMFVVLNIIGSSPFQFVLHFLQENCYLLIVYLISALFGVLGL
ncbi:hypothetical protein Droror1_Dr00020892 [Drosera rotundifolia]